MPFIPTESFSDTNSIDWQLYESAREFKEIGAGISIWARSLDAFDYPSDGLNANILKKLKDRILSLTPNGHAFEDGNSKKASSFRRRQQNVSSRNPL
jgi:hypothetical protein